jgi:NAD(P)-dependent dehydrogenase (short-subunit alcohol dehydrogenase family)
MGATKGGVVVTGAARGIGAAIAARFAEAGHSVAGIDVNADALEGTLGSLPGGPHRGVAGDVGDERVLMQACNAGLEGTGRLDAFVANAGIARPGDSMKYARSDWDELIAVNLTAPFLGARAAASLMPEGGSIVMIASVNAHLGFGGRAAYCAAKAGVTGLVRALAVEWAPRGLRVNAVSPGTIMTDMAKDFVASGFASTALYEDRVPMGKPGEPRDIADAVYFLTSDAARYVTGVTLPVDGGWVINGLGDARQASNA